MSLEHNIKVFQNLMADYLNKGGKKMTQEKLTIIAFNELMAKAFEIKRGNPNLDTTIIAEQACAQYQERKDYDEVVFQVVMNLVNADR